MKPGPMVALGYVLVKPVDRPSWADQHLLPEKLISASKCLCPAFPGVYAIEWTSMTEEERAKDFANAGISPELRAPAMRWATDAFGTELGWENVFYTLEAALAAQARFGLTGSFVLLGIGLPEELLEEFLLEAAPPPRQEGSAPIGEAGWYEVAKSRAAMAEGGRFLGFEPLSIDFGSVQHSWICNGLERHCYDHLGLRPNSHGLISGMEDARRCCEEISRDEVGAEPELWLPCGIIQYDGGDL